MHEHLDKSVIPKSPPVVLVGNPNVGKSVIFGYLSGRYVTVSNFPGTTVEISRGTVGTNGTKDIIIDTPGVNNLLPSSEDERLTLSGVEPGAEIKLYQKLPSYVIKVDETEVALDKDVAREIFVRPFNGKK